MMTTHCSQEIRKEFKVDLTIEKLAGNLPYSRIKAKKNPIIMSTDKENVSNKIQCSFMI